MCTPEYKENLLKDLINSARLEDYDIFSLASTVTQGLLKNKLNNPQEAIRAIVNYSPTMISILKRRIFTREILLSYLYDKNVSVRLPITKSAIIKKILNLWNLKSEDNEKDVLPSESECGSTARESETSISVRSRDSSRLELSRNNADENEEVLTTSIVRKNSDSQSNEIVDRNNINLLAEEFSKWFYSLLNEDKLTAEHFFSDACLELYIANNGEISSQNILNSSQEVAECLSCTKLKFSLFFNPNITKDGLKSQMDSHGLVVIFIQGTLHCNNTCVGVFEQMFALTRDPFAENNWKIKRTKLQLKSSNSGNAMESSRLCISENEED